MKWIGSHVAEIWPFEVRHIMKGTFGTHILREGEVVGVTDRTVGKSDVGFLYVPHCDNCAISSHSAAFAIEYLRRSIQPEF